MKATSICSIFLVLLFNASLEGPSAQAAPASGANGLDPHLPSSMTLEASRPGSSILFVSSRSQSLLFFHLGTATDTGGALPTVPPRSGLDGSGEPSAASIQEARLPAPPGFLETPSPLTIYPQDAPTTPPQIETITLAITTTITTTVITTEEASTVITTTTFTSPTATTVTQEPTTTTVMSITTAYTTATLAQEHEASTVTVFIPGPPLTVTETVSSPPAAPTSNTASHSPEPSSSQSAPTPPSTQAPKLSGLAVWAAPDDMDDLASFNVTSFPGSGKNLQVVKGVPAKANAPSKKNAQRVSAAKAAYEPESDDYDDGDLDDGSSSSSSSSGAPSTSDDSRASRRPKDIPLSPLTAWSPSTRSMQLFYPANSINPAQKPQGGAEFYASPLDVRSARNVSLQFSVYFPPDFDWVLAGKLPGMYGGHTGCSGGNKALDCFSTRLMWRSGGAGELYLYAAKDKQTKELCSDPRSVCDAAYGFSIGRGSFTWAAGAWTTVIQTVVLNTPGKQDGAFTLDVNGKRVIDKDGVFYRDVLWPATKDKGKAKTTSTTKKPVGNPMPTPPPKPTAPHDDPLGDILGPLLSEITHLLGRGEPTMPASGVRPVPSTTGMLSEEPARTMEESEATSLPFKVLATPQRVGDSIGFLGIFFSTFFGGHDEKYATPRDQYVWFKDFAMSYNA